MALAEGPIYCPKCGYDVRALTGDACPECGREIDLDELKRSQIPWANRAAIGRFRAYWRTVWRVTFRTQQFCEEAVRPVDYKDARRFQLVTVFLAYVTCLVTAVIGWFASDLDRNDFLIEQQIGMPAMIVGALTALAALWLFLMAVTGVHTYWFHPRLLPVVRQNRAVAMSYYACAPLALLPIVLVFVAGAALMIPVAKEDRSYEWAVITFDIAIFAWLLLVGAGFWLTCVRMYAVGLGRSGAAAAMFTVVLPLTWAAMAAVILLALPALAVYVVGLLSTLFG